MPSTQQAGLDDPRVRRAVAYMCRRLDQSPTVAELAGEALLSPYHFVRVFKLATGRTPHRYLTGLRIDEVKRMLRGGVTVGEAAMRCGFSSSAHLSAAFLRETGVRPSRWSPGVAEGVPEFTDQEVRPFPAGEVPAAVRLMP